MQVNKLYGFQIFRPEYSAHIVPPTKQELRAIKWHRFKDGVIDVLLIAGMMLCFSISFGSIMSMFNG